MGEGEIRNKGEWRWGGREKESVAHCSRKVARAQGGRRRQRDRSSGVERTSHSATTTHKQAPLVSH